MSNEAFHQNNNNNNDEVPVRKLYIAPVNPTIQHRVYAHFKLFGEVESVRFHLNGDFHYGFVQFKLAKSAERALQQSKHHIGNQVVYAKKAYNHHQPDHYRMGKDTDAENDPLLKLNDDCLRVVFKHLQLQDLCTVAEMCARYKQIADECFKLSYADLHMSELLKIVENDDTWDIDDQSSESDDSSMTFTFDINFIEQVLRVFGTLIGSFATFGLCGCSKKFLSLLSKHCAGTLKGLNLCGFEINGQLISTLRPIFVGLETLCVCHCDTDASFRELLSACSEVKHLRFGHCDATEANSVLLKFPKLVELELAHIDGVEENFLDEMMRLNDSVESLSINHMGLRSIAFKQIANRLPKLQSLRFNQNFDNLGEQEKKIHENLSHFNRLKSLKKLTINCNGFSMNAPVGGMAEAKVPLECLGVFGGTVDLELVESIAALDSLTKLEIIKVTMPYVSLSDVAKRLPKLTELRVRDISGMGFTDVKKMLPFAQNLQELHLTSTTGNLSIDDDTFTSILQIVKNRKNHTKLVITIASHNTSVSVSQSLANTNRYWFEVEEACVPRIDLSGDEDSDDESEEEDDEDEDDDDDDDETERDGIDIFDVLVALLQ